MRHILQISVIILLPFIIGKTVVIDNEKDEFIPTTYPEHIAGAFTGGFGEQSCHSCHFDYELNQPEGMLSVTGIENSFEPGEDYTIQIHVKRGDMARSGFQLTARFEDGSQAGRFELDDDLTTTPNINNNVTYVQHGVGKVEADGGEKSWQVMWVAPEQDQPVIINIAANAANGDASAFGDWIYVKEIRLEP